MPSLPGTAINSGIVPNDSNSVYQTHDAFYGKDGWRSVVDLTARDAIPSQRRAEGMIVWIQSLSAGYQLVGGISDGNWQLSNIGSNASITGNYATIPQVASISGFLQSEIVSISGLDANQALQIAALSGENISQAFQVAALSGENISQAFQVQSLSGNSQSQATQISELSGNSQSAALQIAALSGENISQAFQLASLSGENISQAFQIQSLSGENISQAFQLASLSGENISQATQIAELSGNSQSAAFQIAALSGENISQAFQLQALSGENISQAFQLASLSGENISQAMQISDISANNINQDTLIASISAQVVAIEGEDSNEAFQIAALSGENISQAFQIQSLSGQSISIASQIADISALNSNQDTLISSISAQVVAIEGLDANQALQIAALSGENISQAFQIQALSGENISQAFQLAALSGENISQAFQLASLSGENISQATQINDISANNINQDTLIASISAQVVAIEGEDSNEAFQIAALSGENISQAFQIASLSGNSQSQATQITDISARDSNQDTLIALISGGQLAASVGVIAGIVTCVSGQKTYRVPHAQIYDMTKSVPQISLTIPASGSTLSVMGIYNRALTEFYVELSDAPSISGYYINFNIVNLGTNVYQITGSLITINSQQGDAFSNIQLIGGTAIGISGNGSTITIEVTGTLGDPALRTEVGNVTGFIESQIATITANNINQDTLIASISAQVVANTGLDGNQAFQIAALSGENISQAFQIVSISGQNISQAAQIADISAQVVANTGLDGNQALQIAAVSGQNISQAFQIAALSGENISQASQITTISGTYATNAQVANLSGQYLSLYGGTISGGAILHRIGTHPLGFNDFPQGTAVFVGSTSGSTYAIRLIGMNGARYQSYAYGGTTDAPSALASGITISKIDAHGFDGLTWSTSTASLSLVSESAWTSGNRATNIQLTTTTPNTTGESTKAVLYADGSLQLGGTFGVSGIGAGNLVTSQMISAFGSIPVALSTDLAAVSGRAALNIVAIQTVSAAQQSTLKSGVMFTMDGGGTLLTTGFKGYVTVPYNGVISGWVIIGDVSGTAAVDVWKTSYANFPPSIANTIVGSDAPTLSGGKINENLALTAWTTGVTAGDIFAFNLNSVTSVSRLVTMVNIIRT